MKKLTDYEHGGYAFSGAAGEDVLITDTLMNRFHNAAWKHMQGYLNNNILVDKAGLTSTHGRLTYIENQKNDLTPSDKNLPRINSRKNSVAVKNDLESSITSKASNRSNTIVGVLKNK